MVFAGFQILLAELPSSWLSRNEYSSFKYIELPSSWLSWKKKYSSFKYIQSQSHADHWAKNCEINNHKPSLETDWSIPGKNPNTLLRYWLPKFVPRQWTLSKFLCNQPNSLFAIKGTLPKRTTEMRDSKIYLQLGHIILTAVSVSATFSFTSFKPFRVHQLRVNVAAVLVNNNHCIVFDSHFCTHSYTTALLCLTWCS